MRMLVDAHNDVARLQVAVNEVVRMDVLQATKLNTANVS